MHERSSPIIPREGCKAALLWRDTGTRLTLLRLVERHGLRDPREPGSPERPASIAPLPSDDGGQVVGDVLDPAGRFFLIEEFVSPGPGSLLAFKMEFDRQGSEVVGYQVPDEDGLPVRFEGGPGAFTAPWTLA